MTVTVEAHHGDLVNVRILNRLHKGDVYARKISQLTWWLTTNVTRLPALNAWRRPQAELEDAKDCGSRPRHLGMT